MGYPTLEQYNEAFQHHQLALSDPELKQGSIATNGFGLPLALCGGFALTYTVKAGAKKYAVRCFHKQSNELEKRYSAISTRLKALNSSYFVDFQFQPKGVKVAGNSYPVVKMIWATGTTLGEFLEQNHRNPTALKQLASSLKILAKYLEGQKLAHGDIQIENVMAADFGKKIQLIDYDGMFVEDLRSLGSAELGHRNFQHPKRSSSTWDAYLDRFSFISIDLALRVLTEHPELWEKTQSGGDSILFKANDFSDPSGSVIFCDLFNRSKFSEDAKAFAAICQSSYDKIPSLDNFLAKINRPHFEISITQKLDRLQAQYLSAFPVLDATNYDTCLMYVGDKVELIGQIVEVKQDKTKHDKPYIFINFGPWKGHIVKVSIWSEGLAVIRNKPKSSWVGKWISVVGLMEPPYVNKNYKYSHLSISITNNNQLHVISENEAKFRLAGSSTRANNSASLVSNTEILERLKSGKSPKNSIGRSGQKSTLVTSNQAVLQKMKVDKSFPSSNNRSKGTYTGRKMPSASPSSSSNCFIATTIYGLDAPETKALRRLRDTRLLPTRFGRTFVAIYYKISPFLVPFIKRYKFFHETIKLILDYFIKQNR